MPDPAVYLWNGDYWCEGDIVFKLTDFEPYSQWVDAGHPPGTDDTEEELNAIARRFRVNRNSESSIRRHNFPVLLDAPPSDPHAVCAACLRFFTVPEESAGRPAQTEPERNTVNTMQSAQQRHAEAMLHPAEERERTLVTLFTELTRIADRYRNDTVMLSAVEGLGSVLVKLSGDDDTGRLDGPMLQKQVRDTVRRAGGDDANL